MKNSMKMSMKTKASKECQCGNGGEFELTFKDKHTLLVAKKMHDEGDCISDDGITIAF